MKYQKILIYRNDKMSNKTKKQNKQKIIHCHNKKIVFVFVNINKIIIIVKIVIVVIIIILI